jgi:DNA-binding MarR family transcriptional regulator
MDSPSADLSYPAEQCTLVEDDLGWALGVVFRRYARAATKALESVPGGPRGYQVLAAASGGEPRRQLSLAQQLGIDRTVMTYLLDDLEQAGLVERKPDPSDRRARLIVPTARGRSVMEDLEARLAAAEREVLGGLEESERLLFRTLLQRVAITAGAVESLGDVCDLAQEMIDEPHQYAGAQGATNPAGGSQRTGTNPDS